MKINQIKKGLILVTVASGVLGIGCELIVDFDRTKIPVEVVDATLPDVVAPPPAEGGTDAPADVTPDVVQQQDASVQDADADAGD